MNDKEAVISMDMMLMQSEKLAKMMGHVIVIQNETNDRDMHLHLQYKNIIHKMTSQNFKQSTIQNFFMSQNDDTDSL